MLLENAQVSSLVTAVQSKTWGGKWVFIKCDTGARLEGFLLRGEEKLTLAVRDYMWGSTPSKS